MKVVILLYTLLFLHFSAIAQKDAPTYTIDSTTYYKDSTYKSTGLPVVKRNPEARRIFLKSLGHKKCPEGYQVDHIIPLAMGGSDAPSNMQLLTVAEHRKKTARELKELRRIKYERENKNTNH